MKNESEIFKQLDSFMDSDDKHCLVEGTDIQNKHMNILKYLYNLDEELEILIRINSMQNSEYILKYKAKTGNLKKVGKLKIQVDSMQIKSQDKTHKNFHCVIVYPIESLKGCGDKNITNIMNNINSQKVFWVTANNSGDVSYIEDICSIRHRIIMDNENEEAHKRLSDNGKKLKNKDVIYTRYVDSLYYTKVEEAVNEVFNLGGIYTNSMGQRLTVGSFGNYVFGGHKATKRISIKVKEEKQDGKYVLLMSLN
ncbi:MAG: hypothetical protein ACRDD7_03605 [Peptostreptococcaceae bacterium]